MELAVVLAAVLGVVVGASAAVLTMRPRATDGVRSDAPDVLRREIERARRYERRFVLIRLDARATPLRGPSVLDAVTPLIRDLDYAWVERSGVHVLLPEVGRDEGLRCLERLRTAVEFDEGHYRIVVFPEDTVTAGGLMLHLDGASVLPGPTDLPGARHGRVAVDSDGTSAS